jgi:hypothetical protein
MQLRATLGAPSLEVVLLHNFDLHLIQYYPLLYALLMFLCISLVMIHTLRVTASTSVFFSLFLSY